MFPWILWNKIIECHKRIKSAIPFIITFSSYLYTSHALPNIMIKKYSIIISGLFLLSLMVLTTTGSSLSFAQQPPIFSANQSGNNTQTSNIFYKGPVLAGIRVYDYYKSEQWQAVENMIFQGFEIKSIIPAAQLPNSGAPMGVLVILEKK